MDARLASSTMVLVAFACAFGLGRGNPVSGLVLIDVGKRKTKSELKPCSS